MDEKPNQSAASTSDSHSNYYSDHPVGPLYGNWEVGHGESSAQPTYDETPTTTEWRNGSDPSSQYPTSPRDSVTNQTDIHLYNGKGKGNVGRRKLCFIIAIIVTLLVLISVAVALGVVLTRSDHPCAKCDCETSVLIGRITDVNNLPMSGAVISHADQLNNTLAISEMTGRFRIIGVCATPQRLVVQHALFAIEEQLTTCSAYKQENCTSYFNAQIKRLEVPFITENPRSKLRVKGQKVAFCCSAEGVPSPTKYEWLKNGDLVDNTPSNGDKLVLTDLTEDNSGMYTCRVHNEAGTIISDAAKLTVAEESVTCDPEPRSHTIQLPDDCVQPDTNKAEFDVGSCENKRCTGKLSDQTLCDDLESESYCCQEQGLETVFISCQGYTLPVQRVTSCGCSQCNRIPSRIIGRVVSAKTLETLDSVVVSYKDQNVTETDAAGTFVFSTDDAVSRVSLTFRDVKYKRVLDTTVVFQVSSTSVRYGLIKMIPLYETTPVFFDGKIDNTLSLLNNGDNEQMVEITIPANTVYTKEGVIYNGTVRVVINNIDMRNQTQAELTPGDSTTVDDNGYKVPLRLFGVFSLQFTDPSGDPLSVAGEAQIRLTHPALLDQCQQQYDSDDHCNIMIWKFNTKSGIWEKASLLEVTTDGSGSGKKKRRQASEISLEVVIGNLVLRDYEWYGIADIDNKQRCWAKVIGYSDANFNPATVLPYMHRVTAVLKQEVQQSEQEADDKIQIFRISQPSSVTWNGEVGVCVPLTCSKDYTTVQTDVFITARVDETYLEPAAPNEDGQYYSLKAADKQRVGYHIAYHDPEETEPQILLLSPLADTNGPVYSGGEAGEVDGTCSLAGLEKTTKHFQFHCPICNDVICNTFHSVAKSPIHRQLQTFYPNSGPSQKFQAQDYCFIGLRIMTNSSSVKVIATSNSSEGLFYGRREVTLRKSLENDEYLDACMEFKCSGDVYNGRDSNYDVTKVSIDVIDTDSNSCSIQTTAQDFSMEQNRVPFTFNDPQTYGQNIGLHKDSRIRFDPVCANDEHSPQTTVIDRCRIFNDFVHAAVINCP